MNEDNSAAERPERSATKPAIINERITAGPAIPDATPIRTKIPVPIIAPMLCPLLPRNLMSGVVQPWGASFTISSVSPSGITLIATTID